MKKMLGLFQVKGTVIFFFPQNSVSALSPSHLPPWEVKGNVTCM